MPSDIKLIAKVPVSKLSEPGGRGGVEIRVAPDFDRSVLTLSPPSQLPGGLSSPSDICKKLSHHFLLHFPIGMDSYDHHVKYQGVFP